MLLRIIAASCILACTSWIGTSQAGPDGIAIPFTAKTGDRFRLLSRRELKVRSGDKLAKHTVQTDEFDGEVTEVRAQGYVFRLTLRTHELRILLDNQIDRASKAKPRDPFSEALVGLPFEFETDASGRPTRILDWDRLRPRWEDALRKSFASWHKDYLETVSPPLPAETIETRTKAQTEQTLKLLFENMNELTAVLNLQEQMLVASVQNRTLVLNTRVKDERSPPEVGRPNHELRTAYFMLRAHDPAKGQASLEWQASHDDNAVVSAVTEGQKKMIPPDTPPEKRSELEKSIAELWAQTRTETGESGHAIVGLPGGWVRKLESTSWTRMTSRRFQARESVTTHSIEIIAQTR